jgi:hypothetical protein
MGQFSHNTVKVQGPVRFGVDADGRERTFSLLEVLVRISSEKP